jgi:hypothetical protein
MGRLCGGARLTTPTLIPELSRLRTATIGCRPWWRACAVIPNFGSCFRSADRRRWTAAALASRSSSQGSSSAPSVADWAGLRRSTPHLALQRRRILPRSGLVQRTSPVIQVSHGSGNRGGHKSGLFPSGRRAATWQEWVQDTHSLAKSGWVQDTHSLAKSECRSVVIGTPSPVGSC